MEAHARVEDLTVAWDWVLRLREESASQDDLAEWLQWYEADDRHREAFEEMQALWHESARLGEGPQGAAVRQLLEEPVRAAPRVPIPRYRHVFAVAAAAVIATVALVWMKYESPPRPVSVAPAIVRETQLPDGSRVEMAARSTVTTHYTESERLLDMQGTAGEAYFSVAKNPARPFVVQVGAMRVRALGTAFNIRRANERVVVSVTEGRVEISSPDAAGNAAGMKLRLAAGQRVALNLAEKSASKIAPVDSGRALAWQRGRLEYLNEPLASVIADVNRYTKRRVQIGDPAAGGILVTGTVFTNDIEGWLGALPGIFPVLLKDGGDDMVLLSRREH